MRTLGIVRRLVGCFYCGYPCPGDVCGYCSDLPLKDPLVNKARQPLSEAELMVAASKRDPDGSAPLSAWVAGVELHALRGEQERMKAAG